MLVSELIEMLSTMDPESNVVFRVSGDNGPLRLTEVCDAVETGVWDTDDTEGQDAEEMRKYNNGQDDDDLVMLIT